MLQLSNITKTFVVGDIETTALRQVTLTIESGEFVAVMGPSGCGKSTLLSILGLIDMPDSGHYQFFSEEVVGHREGKLAQLRSRHIGFIFQNFNLIDELNVRQNIELPLIYQKVESKARQRRVDEVLKQVGMEHRGTHMPSQLSGGQQQRTAVARALVSSPKLLLADEPTGNLDTKHGMEVMDLLSSLNKGGVTIVMVTHSLPHAQIANRLVYLVDGQLQTG